MLGARTVLVLAMLLALSPRCDAAPYTLRECCFAYTEEAVRLANLKDFYVTPVGCFTQAIVFETKKGGKLCANPEAGWVERAVKELQKRKRLDAP